MLLKWFSLSAENGKIKGLAPVIRRVLTDRIKRCLVYCSTVIISGQPSTALNCGAFLNALDSNTRLCNIFTEGTQSVRRFADSPRVRQKLYSRNNSTKRCSGQEKEQNDRCSLLLRKSCEKFEQIYFWTTCYRIDSLEIIQTLLHSSKKLGF